MKDPAPLGLLFESLVIRDLRVFAQLGQTRVDEAAASLTKLVPKIDTSRAGEPSARLIITGGEYAYTRPDGIHVIPLGCLGP